MSRSRELTADDLGCKLRVECVGAFGGEPVVAISGIVQMDGASKVEMAKIKKRGEATFTVRAPRHAG